MNTTKYFKEKYKRTYLCFSRTDTDFSGSFFFCSTFLLGTPLGSSVNTRLHLGKTKLVKGKHLQTVL